ncbi:4067_t:CDS:1, partial [Funneliformis geosporum]
ELYVKGNNLSLPTTKTFETIGQSHQVTILVEARSYGTSKTEIAYKVNGINQ